MINQIADRLRIRVLSILPKGKYIVVLDGTDEEAIAFSKALEAMATTTGASFLIINNVKVREIYEIVQK